MLASYAALVKNLRGVVYLDPYDEEAGKCIRWLAERFRYRGIGVPPSLVHPHLEEKPFRKLFYPDDSVRELCELVASVLQVGEEACEAVLLASCFASPVLALGDKAAEALRQLAVDGVTSRKKMQVRDWKLHLRIADYSVLDLYEWSTENAQMLWRGEALEGFAEERKRRIEKDKRRYWRLEEGEEEPWRFMLYLDVASLLAEKLGEGVSRRLRRISSGACAALAIEGAVLISPARIG